MGIDWSAELDKPSPPDTERMRAAEIVTAGLESESEIVRVLAALAVTVERASWNGGATVIEEPRYRRRGR